MPEFITLTCPSCRGKLKISEDIDRFACAYCGAEHIVKRGGGIVSLMPILEEVKGVRKATDSTAAELAIVRIQKEIEDLRQYRDSLTIEVHPLSEIIWWITTITFVVSVFWYFINNDDMRCFIPIGFGILILLIPPILNKSRKVDLMAKIDEVNEIIYYKKEQLRKHQKVVDGF